MYRNFISSTSFGIESWLHCENIHSDDTELPGDALFRGAAEGVEALAHGDVAKSRPCEDLDKLSLRESTSNSTCPEVDVLPNRLRQLTADHDVSIKKATGWLEDPEDFAIRNRLVRGQVEHAVGDHHVNAGLVEWQ